MPKLSSEDQAVLGRIPLLAGLDQERLAPLLADARVKQYTQGLMLFLQGDPADRFYVVLNGWVKLWRETASGEETVVGIFARGESFAEAAIFGSGQYPVSAEVVSDARLLMIPAKPLINEIKQDPALALRMLATMSLHMRQLIAQLEQVQARSATQRVAVFLLRLGQGDAGAQVIDLPYDKSLVAARLGMRPETFSRALSQLREIGVQVKGSHVTVAEVDNLVRFCQDEPGP